MQAGDALLLSHAQRMVPLQHTEALHFYWLAVGKINPFTVIKPKRHDISLTVTTICARAFVFPAIENTFTLVTTHTQGAFTMLLTVDHTDSKLLIILAPARILRKIPAHYFATKRKIEHRQLPMIPHPCFMNSTTWNFRASILF